MTSRIRAKSSVKLTNSETAINITWEFSKGQRLSMVVCDLIRHNVLSANELDQVAKVVAEKQSKMGK